jgi:hypothetical protein
MTTAMALPFTVPAHADRAAAERSVGRLLGRLGPDGYVVLPDGVVVGPTGVTVVAESVTRSPGRHERARLDKRALQVRAVTAAVDLRLPVRTMVCVVGDEAGVADRIRSAPAVLAFDQVLRLAKDLEAARRRRSALPSFRRHRR